MAIRGEYLIAGALLIHAASALAAPFSITVPGQAFDDAAIITLPLTIPPGFQEVQALELELTGLSHENPDDIDVYLVNPFGVVAELMTDRGGAIPVSNLTIVFSDSGSSVASEDGPLTAGLYRPEGLDEGNDGGLAGLTTSIPATDPWVLLLIDDTPGGTGSIVSVTLRGEGTVAEVPSVSEWGLVVLVLSGVIAGTMLFKSPTAAAAS